ncbi:MAG: glycoside hydrolase family 3 N-terminal domain-containing protein [Eubacteriales bacterium]
MSVNKEACTKRVNELYDEMTWDEKILQLGSFFPNGVKRLKIANMQQGECLHGIKVEEATSFPQAIAMGSTWNPALIEQVSTVIARECRVLGVHHCYTPMLGVARDIRWGRTEEAYGEDPHLVAKIGAAFINGLQGVGEERFAEDRVVATAKHFVGDAEPLSGNNGASVDISERLLHEVHLVPFREAVEEAHVASIMPAHHALNGTPCHMNEYILKDVLRDRYGFEGILVSDNGDIRCIKNLMGITETITDAAILCLKAGVDTELAWLCAMGPNRAYGPELLKACKEGKVPEEVIETSVKRVLALKYELGLLDVEDLKDDEAAFFDFQGDTTGDEHIHYADTMQSFGVKADNYKEVLYAQDANDLAYECGVQAITLLKNENNLLPLSTDTCKKIAIIGPNGDTRLLGGYSTSSPRYFISILDGIKEFVGDKAEVEFVTGCNPAGFEPESMEEAVALAKEVDVVILAVGGNEETCKENQDVDTLDFVGDQKELIRKVYEANSNVVMVLMGGRPNAIEWESENIPAIFECFYLGQETGHCFADVLFGVRNPGGKLPLSMPRNVGQCPAFYNKYPFGRAQNYYKSSHKPLFPFGFGLSYTKFELSAPRIDKVDFRLEDDTYIHVDVTNVGDRVGDEVVQLYVHDVLASLVRPNMELKGFERITLHPGETKTVSFKITERMLEFWKNGDFVTEAGAFQFMVGTSCEDTETIVGNLVK